MNKCGKIAAICVLTAAVLIGLAFVLKTVSDNKKNPSTDDLSEYSAYLNRTPDAGLYMPSVDALGPYLCAGLSGRHDTMIWGNHSVCLFLQYSAEEYEAQKQRIEESYRFYTSPTEHFRDISGCINGFRMTPVVLDQSSILEVKKCFFVGFNVESRSILYAFFYDDSRDYIDNLEITLADYFYIPKDWRS